MLRVPDIAEELNVSIKTVHRWIEDGKLEAYRFGKDYRITPEAYQAFLEKSKVTPNGEE